MQLTLEMTGTRPMLQHNGRLSNPLDEHTQALKALQGKRKKTDEDLIALMMAEARAGFWETPDGLVGVPSAAVWRCLFDAAKAFRMGQDVKRALVFSDVVEPLLIDGKETTCDDYLKQSGKTIDYRPVKVQTSRVMRARPLIPEGWKTTHRFELLTDVIEPRDLEPVIERAGRLCGLGDWRPTYGTFTTEASVEEASDAA
jgi:hypothetical protein